MTRYTMPARSQGALYMQRATGRLAEKDVHRWVFVHSMDPEVEFTVRKWLSQRLDGFYCDVQAAYMPRRSLATDAMTHIVLQYPPAPTARAESDEIIPVGLQGAGARAAVKEIIKSTGLNPHLSVCGWPFCLDELDDVTAEGGAA
nr:MAG TPA: hypothetical protein [Caudoviricetes sp.]